VEAEEAVEVECLTGLVSFLSSLGICSAVWVVVAVVGPVEAVVVGQAAVGVDSAASVAEAVAEVVPAEVGKPYEVWEYGVWEYGSVLYRVW
jgi:hypothetical protein